MASNVLADKRFPALITSTLVTISFFILVGVQVAQISRANATVPETLKVLDISERAYDGGNAIAITFNEPVDSARDIDRYLTVITRNNVVPDGSWILDNSARVAYFTQTEPESDYLVIVQQGLRAASGNLLQKTEERRLQTRKIQPGVRFSSDNNFLPVALSRGLPVEATNVDEVNIDFLKITGSKIPGFLKFMRARSGSNWHPYYLGELSNYGDLVYSGRFALQSEPNKRRQHDINLSDIPALGAAGVYVAIMSRPAHYREPREVLHFVRTDIGIHARIYGDRVDVYLSSIAEGTPKDGIELSVTDTQGRILHRARTDSNGYASFHSVNSDASVIHAIDGAHYSYLSLQGPSLDLAEFDIGKRLQRREEIFIYGPRNLYRPGEQIDIAALRRNHDGKRLSSIPLAVKILRPDRATASAFTWHPDETGFYHHQYQLPDSAETGNWTIQVNGIDSTPVEYTIKVEDFLPERMEIEFNQGLSDPIVIDEASSFSLPVTGRYLHGAPTAGNRVNALLSVRKAANPVKKLAGFEFGHLNETLKQPISTQDIRLDAKGSGIIQSGAHWQSIQAALEVVFVTSLYESGGRPVTRTYTGFVWPENDMIGIKPDFGPQENPRANSRPGFQIVKSDIDGNLSAASNLEIRLVREDRQYFWEYNENQGWHWNWTESEYPVYSALTDVSISQATRIEVPVEYGHYRLEVHDPDNNNQVSSVRFHAGEDWYYWWRRNNSDTVASRPDQVMLALDSAAYQAGDTARLRIVSPHAGQAIVAVESDRLLWFKRIQVDAGGSTLEIPVNQYWDSHDIYVSAVVFKPGDSEDSITPNRTLGMIHLPLYREDRKLDVDINVGDNLMPDQTHDIRVQVKAAKPGSYHLTLAAVDVGALAISDFDTPDPVDAFFGQRRYSPDQRDMYNKIIELQRARDANLRFGGDAMLSRGGEMARADVQIVSLFSGRVAVGDDGSAAVPITIPEFNGRLRLMALAFGDDAYGSAEQEVTVRSPLIADISMPRFLAFGDESEFTLDITNVSGAHRDLTVNLDSSGPLTLDSDNGQVISLDDGERTILRVKAIAGRQAGQTTIRLQLSGEGVETLEKQWKLAIRSAYPATTRTVTGLLSEGENLTLADRIDTGKYLDDSLQALVSISSQADLRLQENLRQLIRYPYGCLEQTTSTAYPLAFATASNLEAVGITGFTRNDIQDRIDTAVRRLSGLQKTNGGFGLWNPQSMEEEWLTAYVVDFLLMARNNGFVISEPMLNNALSRLESYVRRQGTFSYQRYSDQPEHYAFAAKAYAAYLLASVNRVPLGTLRTLYDRESGNTATALPVLQLGLALKLQGDTKRATEAFESVNNNLQNERKDYLGDYGSDVRDLGMMTHLLIKHEIDTALASELAFVLEKQLLDQHWLSTQERNALFLAGMSLQELATAPWEAEIHLGETIQAVSARNSLSRGYRSKAIGQQLMVVARKGDRINTSVSITGYLKEPPEPESQGMTIRKLFYNSDGNLTRLDQIKSGDLVLVDVVVSSEQRAPDTLVVDLLPAGFELENQNLQHAVSLGEFSIDGKPVTTLQERVNYQHQEFRDDRYIAAIDLPGHQEVHLVYLARAVTPGHYTTPSALVEDMYRPWYRAVSEPNDNLRVHPAD